MMAAADSDAAAADADAPRLHVPILVVDGSRAADASKASGPCIAVLKSVSRLVGDRLVILLDTTIPEQRKSIPSYVKYEPVISFPNRHNDALLCNEERGFYCLWRLVDFLAAYCTQRRIRCVEVSRILSRFVNPSFIPACMGGSAPGADLFNRMLELKSRTAASRPPPHARTPTLAPPRTAATPSAFDAISRSISASGESDEYTHLSLDKISGPVIMLRDGLDFSTPKLTKEQMELELQRRQAKTDQIQSRFKRERVPRLSDLLEDPKKGYDAAATEGKRMQAAIVRNQDDARTQIKTGPVRSAVQPGLSRFTPL